MFEDIINNARAKMEDSVKALQTGLSKLRTGRASLAMLDGIRVDYYGTMSPLNQVATLAIPEPRLITIQPWEASMISPIEKAIEKANIGLNPVNDGKMIRLPIPQLTEERRREIVKQLKQQAEESRVSIRQARKEANEAIKAQEKVSEDEQKKGLDQVQKMTDEFTKKIDEIAANKEKDIMTV